MTDCRQDNKPAFKCMFEVFHMIQEPWIMFNLLKTRAPITKIWIIGIGRILKNVTVAVIKFLRAQCQRGERQGFGDSVAVGL